MSMSKRVSTVNPICIRSHKDNEQCGGRACCSCGRVFCCGEKHVCAPKPERIAMGVERRQTFAERLSAGMKMLAEDDT